MAKRETADVLIFSQRSVCRSDSLRVGRPPRYSACILLGSMLMLANSEGGACEATVARGGSIDAAYFGGCRVCDCASVRIDVA